MQKYIVKDCKLKFTIFLFSLFPYLSATIPLLFADNRLEITFYIHICIFIVIPDYFLVKEIVSARFQICRIPFIRRIMQNTGNSRIIPPNQARTISSPASYHFITNLSTAFWWQSGIFWFFCEKSHSYSVNCVFPLVFLRILVYN